MKWRERFNKKYMQISLYVIITTVIITFLILIIWNAPLIARFLFDKVQWVIRVIRPVIIGFVFAYLMDPAVNFFERKFRKLTTKKLFRWIKRPRTWAVLISVIILFSAFVGLISLLVYSVTNQLRLANFDDIVKLGEEYMNTLNDFYNFIVGELKELDIQSQEFEQYVENATTFILNALMGFADATLESVTNISGYLTTIIFSFIIGIYFMIDGRMFMNYITKVCKALLSDNANRRILRTVHDLDDVFSGYIRGQLTDALVMMVLISLVLSIIGVKFSVVIGIFAGIGNLIPYFGPIIAYFSTAIVCLINGDIRTLIIAVIALLIIQTVDGNLIGPKLLSKSIKIHPLIIIVSLIFGSALGGFLGMLVAVPVGAFMKLVFVRFIDNRLERKEELKNIN